MRERVENVSLQRQIMLETAIAAVSTLGMLGFIILLAPDPNILGGNIARTAPFLLPMLLIPAFRNLVEFHGELLYAREFVLTRLALLCGLTAMKLGLMAVLLLATGDIVNWAFALTGVFAIVYIASGTVTYGRLRPRMP
jgi:hypothetical protein